MEHKQDVSYGVVPFIKEGESWKVFLIHQYGSAGDIFWTFPKGHPEAVETPEEAARREVFEETGITLQSLLVEHPLTQSYQFKHGDVLIDKTVTYFVGICDTTDFVLQAEEVKDAGWFTLAEAQAKLTHESAKAILAQAVTLLP